MPLEYTTTQLRRGKLMEVLNRVQYQRMDVVITHYGQPMVRIVPLEDKGAVVSDPTTGIAPGVPAGKRKKT